MTLPSFALLETIRLDAGLPIRLERHVGRMAASARHFGFPWNEPAVRAAIEAAGVDHATGVWRMRVTLDAAGTVEAACLPHADHTQGPWRVAFANAPVESADPFLANKTTNRAAYDAARRGRPDVDDVLLWNERGEATESTIANLVVEIDAARWTPPLASGLLPGTLRAELLEAGHIGERLMRRGEVMRAPRIWLINSLRGWVDAVVVR